jgi:phosphatidylinositol alpha-1,6-mannosyltransferase
MLIRAMPPIRRRVRTRPADVGGDPTRIARRWRGSARGRRALAGQVPEELPRYYAVGDVFAMPCRTWLAGLESRAGERLHRAAACACPWSSGTGGAREALPDGEDFGILVDGADVGVADAWRPAGIPRARRLGRAGRERVLRDHTAPDRRRLAGWLRDAAAEGRPKANGPR